MPCTTTRAFVFLALCACTALIASGEEPATSAAGGPELRWVAPGEIQLMAGEVPATPQSPAPPTASAPARDLSLEMLRLRDQVCRTLATYYPKRLNTRDHNPWELMHAIIGWGVHAQIDRNGPGGTPVNAVSWMAVNGRCAGHELLYLNRGRIEARKGPYVQGHYGQLLAILAQSRIMPDYPLYVGGREFKVADLIESEKITCQSDTELTFKLISLMHYLDSDAEWVAEDGQRWSLPRLIEEEIRSPIRGAACGGTHRLMGLSYAVQKRQSRGEPMDGQYLRAQRYLTEYHKYAFSLQNSDGSFSTNWFAGREAKPDNDRRIQTTGHILEWLAYSLPAEALDDPPMVRAVNYLSRTLLSSPRHEWSVGPLGHAIHALALYNERMFGAPLEVRPDRLMEYNLAMSQRRRAQHALQQRQAAGAEQRRVAEPAGPEPSPPPTTAATPVERRGPSSRRVEASAKAGTAAEPSEAVKLPTTAEPALLDEVLQLPVASSPPGTAADAPVASPETPLAGPDDGPLERQAMREPPAAQEKTELILGPVLRAPAQLEGDNRTLKR